MAKPRPLPGLPAWTARLSKKRQRELHAALTEANRRAAAALQELSRRVEAEIRAEQPAKAFVEEYNRGVLRTLHDVARLSDLVTFPERQGGYQAWAVNGHALRPRVDGRLTFEEG